MVSSGTGREKLLDPDGYLHNVILSFVQRATNTEARHQEVLKDDAFKDVGAVYFRFQGIWRSGRSILRMQRGWAISRSWHTSISIQAMVRN
jgi:hypothetical protein